MSTLDDAPVVHADDRVTWRDWLEANHATAGGAWLVTWRRRSGRRSLDYEAAVEEALCFGWIDSLIKRLDEDRYARKFTPRTDPTRWSASNLARVARLEETGRMTPAGRAKIAAGVIPEVPPARRVQEVPDDFRAALEAHPRARMGFEGLSPSQRRLYVGWVAAAKREETRRRRLAEALARLAEGEPLGMK